jgi:hypothetical protein
VPRAVRAINTEPPEESRVKIEVADQAMTDRELQLEGIDFITSGDQYLTFTLGEEHYAIDILTVKEIRGWDELEFPDFARDLIKLKCNLNRGNYEQRQTVHSRV